MPIWHLKGDNLLPLRSQSVTSRFSVACRRRSHPPRPGGPAVNVGFPGRLSDSHTNTSRADPTRHTLGAGAGSHRQAATLRPPAPAAASSPAPRRTIRHRTPPARSEARARRSRPPHGTPGRNGRSPAGNSDPRTSARRGPRNGNGDQVPSSSGNPGRSRAFAKSRRHPLSIPNRSQYSTTSRSSQFIESPVQPWAGGSP